MPASLPFPFTEKHPCFRIPGWTQLLGTDQGIGAPEMARHFLVTGETGSGKSVSAVMRLLEGILRYPEQDPYREYAEALGEKAEPQADLRPAVPVIDPKRELREVAEREAQGRRVVKIAYGESGKVLHLFEGRNLKTMDAFEALDLILQQSDFFTLDQQRTSEPCWNMQAASILRDFMCIDMWLARQDKNLVARLWEDTRKALAKQSEFGGYGDKLKYDRVNYFRPHSTVLSPGL